MNHLNYLNQYTNENTQQFGRLIAEYKARVYETYFLATGHIAEPTHRSVTNANSDYRTTILVIEDDTDHWFLTRGALLQHFTTSRIDWLTQAYEVIPYLDVCQQQERDLPRIILVDLYLPDRQRGLSILQQLKFHPLYKSVPTIVLSSSSAIEDIDQVFEHSADGYLIKPANGENWQNELKMLESYWK
ncbi:response regulator [Spirosoma flavum]|uniref:Response regulator n=1 Tax=Spirosoma flavum TaxID=2048557 RepID=A0ABW6ARE4_9BACT